MEATLRASKGGILAEFSSNHAPKTIHNFITLARGEREWVGPNTRQKTFRPFFDGTIFRRVISDFVVQDGDPLGTGTGGPGYQFGDETHPELTFGSPYVLVMANADKRTDRNANGSQFFITVAPTQWLFGKHTILDKVVDRASKDVIDTIAAAVTGANDRPVEGVVIESMTISE